MKLEQINRASGSAIAFIAAIVLFVVLGLTAKLLIHVPAVDEDRKEVIGKALADMRTAEDKALNNAVLTDKARGTYQLPIDTAVKVAAEKWTDSAAARADLAARLTKATAPVKAVSFE